MSELMKMYEEGLKGPKEFTGTPIDVLIDGDIPAYRAASATDGKVYIVCTPEGIYSSHKYKKSADREVELCPGSTLEVRYSPEPIPNALHNVDKSIEDILKAVSEHFRRPVIPYVFYTGKSNFRNEVHPEYKSSRKEVRRPAHLEVCKKHLEDTYDAEYLEGYEADDLLSIESYMRAHKDCVIATVDKDLLQVPGHHFNIVKNEFQVISKEEGMHLFWKQVLTGDKVDDIEGIYGIGPVKAEKLLADLKFRSTDWHYYQRVLQIYKSNIRREDVVDTETLDSTPESDTMYFTRIIKRLTRTARLLYLCRSHEDMWNPPGSDEVLPSIAPILPDVDDRRDLLYIIRNKEEKPMASARLVAGIKFLVEKAEANGEFLRPADAQTAVMSVMEDAEFPIERGSVGIGMYAAAAGISFRPTITELAPDPVAYAKLKAHLMKKTLPPPETISDTMRRHKERMEEEEMTRRERAAYYDTELRGTIGKKKEGFLSGIKKWWE